MAPGLPTQFVTRTGAICKRESLKLDSPPHSQIRRTIRSAVEDAAIVSAGESRNENQSCSGARRRHLRVRYHGRRGEGRNPLDNRGSDRRKSLGDELPGPNVRLGRARFPRRFRTCAALLVSGMAAGCGHGTAIGHSLLSGGQFSVTFSRPVPVGQEFALQFTDLSNTSESAVVLKSVRISGRGVGTVAAVEHIAIVPWAKGNGGNALADTIYQTYPPAGTVRRGHCSPGDSPTRPRICVAAACHRKGAGAHPPGTPGPAHLHHQHDQVWLRRPRVHADTRPRSQSQSGGTRKTTRDFRRRATVSGPYEGAPAWNQIGPTRTR